MEKLWIKILILTSFCLLSFCQKRSRRSRVDPPLCRKPPEWTVADGLDLMAESRGKIAFIALMEVHCQFCHKQINGIKNLKKTLEGSEMDGINFYIIAPKNESKSWVEYWKRALKDDGIKVYADSTESPIWSNLNGHNHDLFIYDRCGRLIYFIPHPQSNMYFHYTVSSLFDAYHYQHVGCGYCRFDSEVRRRLSNERRNFPKIRPPVRTAQSSAVKTPHYPSTSHTKNNYSASGYNYNRSPTRLYQHENSYSNLPPEDNQASVSVSVVSNSYTDPYSSASGRTSDQEETKISSKKSEETVVKGDPIESTTEGEKSDGTTIGGQKEKEDSMSGVEEEVILPKKAKNVDVESVPQPEKWSETDEKEEVEEEEAFEGEDFEIEPEGYEGEYAYEYEDENDFEFATPEPNSDLENGVESTETSTAQAAPTKNPETLQDVATEPGVSQTKPPKPSRKPKFIGGASCEEYTDEICLEQQNDIGLEKRHPCCYKGIYLTGKCQPELCSDNTYNVCCFQKFIQARYLCCYNRTLQGKKSDEFSHCCYENFVYLDKNDPCCPASVASQYWSEKTSLFELCLPNVDIDFSDMVLETKLKDESTLKLQLGKHKVLQYTCPYAKLRDFFFFWQPNGEANVTELNNHNKIHGASKNDNKNR